MPSICFEIAIFVNDDSYCKCGIAHSAENGSTALSALNIFNRLFNKKTLQIIGSVENIIKRNVILY